MKTTLSLFAVAALAGAIGWFARPHLAGGNGLATAEPGSGRKILYYQSPMHPWIRSDKPGKCTVCGMDLVPIHEGEALTEGNLVTLSADAVTVTGVETAAVAVQPLVRTLTFAGTIDDDDTRHRILSAYADGRIDALFVNYEGEQVSAGQKLASFYSPMLLTAVREHLALKGTTGETPALLAGAAMRLRQLGLSEDQITALPTTFHETDLTVDILSPMSGTVVKRIAYTGRYVKEGDPLFELGDFTTMWLKFDAYERDLAWLRPGQTVEVTTPSLPGRVFTNAVTFIDPNLDPATRSAKVRVEIPNPVVVEGGRTNRLLRHRLFADARVRSAFPPVLAVPRGAALNSGGSPLVYVEHTNGAYEPRSVQLGRVGDEVVEVSAGLSAGERVVTQGNLLLDAQSQIAGQGRPAGSSAGNAAPPMVRADPLTTEARRSIGDFLKAADAAREALAADDLAGFNAAAMKLRVVVAALPKDTGVPSLAAAATTAHLPEAKSLPSARQAFYPFSMALVALARDLHAAGADFTGLKLYQCPMVKRAFPDAPKTASWIQFGGPIRNPWFGAEMIDCGSELKP